MMRGSTSPSEFDEMDAEETKRLAVLIRKAAAAEVELRVTLAKFVAGARIQQQAEEVR